MTTKRIVYRRSDGVVEIVNPGRPRMAELMAGGKTEDEAITVIQANAFSKLPDRGFGPPGDAEVMEAAAIPQSQPGNRMFRNALEKPGVGPPTVNMPRARVIKTDLIRRERDARLAVEDIELIKADEAGDMAEVNRIKAKKMALRDIPADVQVDLDAITMPDTLESFEPMWPT